MNSNGYKVFNMGSFLRSRKGKNLIKELQGCFYRLLISSFVVLVHYSSNFKSSQIKWLNQ